MRKLTCLITALMLMTGIRAQLYDNTWIMGIYCGKASFNGSQVIADSFDHDVNTYLTWASMCNGEGELQFFTTGTRIYDKNGNIMPNGLGISDDVLTNANATGLPFDHGALCFPKKDGQYYSINYSISDEQYNSGSTYSADQLFYAIVDMNLNNGLGDVVSKRNFLNNDTMLDNHLTACRHANGRDWWLIASGYNNNEYLKWLVTPDSIIRYPSQFIGASYGRVDLYGQIIFSPDGSKLAGASSRSNLVLLDFDRCTGEFSNPIAVPIPFDTIFPQMEISGGGVNALAFSPSGRYLYMLNRVMIYQYDLTETDLAGTRKRVYQWSAADGYTYTNGGYLAPNGEIIIANYHGVGTTAYHLIKHPDEPDTACQFQLNGLYIPANGKTHINNTFNYRLGALIGSSCDTIVSGITEITGEQIIKISPNPATNKITIQLRTYLPDAHLIISDGTGSIVYRRDNYYLDEYLDISQWQTGVYFVKIYNAEKAVTARFVKE